jgi:hypothetical protein
MFAMYKALHLSPMIPSFEIKKTASFFINQLGFNIVRDDLTYVILHKDTLLIHILTAGAEIGQMELYLEVDDIQDVWDLIKGEVAELNVKPPFDQEYGMREIHIGIPSTNALLFIGQVIN